MDASKCRAPLRKSGKRMVGSYEYDRKDMESMLREVKALYPAYKEDDGYTFEIIEPL